MIAAVGERPVVERLLDTAAPEPLFVLSAIAQYAGATIATLLFDEVAPRTVAWLRVAGAAVVLARSSRRERCAVGHDGS